MKRVVTALQHFAATEYGPTHLQGRSVKNTCNRAAQFEVQFETSLGLRNRLVGHAQYISVDEAKIRIKSLLSQSRQLQLNQVSNYGRAAHK